MRRKKNTYLLPLTTCWFTCWSTWNHELFCASCIQTKARCSSTFRGTAHSFYGARWYSQPSSLEGFFAVATRRLLGLNKVQLTILLRNASNSPVSIVSATWEYLCVILFYWHHFQPSESPISCWVPGFGPIIYPFWIWVFNYSLKQRKISKSGKQFRLALLPSMVKPLA